MAEPAKDLDRVQRNVEKLIGIGAPAPDIDKYLSGEGYTAESFRSAVTEKPQAPLDPQTDYFLNKRGFMEKLQDAAMQGVTLGFGDEIMAGLMATTESVRKMFTDEDRDWAGDYNKELTRERAGLAKFNEEHPIASTAATLAGGLALPMPALKSGGAPAATIAGRALQNPIAKLAGTGAAYGAVAGFGGAEGGPTERAIGTGMGAGLGATIGAVAPGAAMALGRGARLAGRAMGLQDPTKRAQDYVLRKMGQDEVTPQTALRAFTSTDKPVSLADQGPQLTRAARTIETIPGRGSSMVTEKLTERQMGQGERVAKDVRQGISNADFHPTFQALADARSTAAAPLYEQAFQIGPVYSGPIQRFLDNPRVQEGIKRGIAIIRDEATASGKPMNLADYAITGFDASGAPILGKTPTLRLLDAAKRGLDDMLQEAAMRDPMSGRWTQAGRAVDQMRAAFVKELDRLTTNPATGKSLYADARAAWAGPSQSMEAMQLGRRFAQGDTEVMEQTYKALSPTDREFFKMGVAREIEGDVLKARDGWDVITRIFGSKEQRGRLRSLFDDPREFAAFEKRMKDEARMFLTKQVTMGNSVTGRIAADQAEAAGLDALLMDFARGGKGGLVSGLISRGTNRAAGLNEPTAAEVGRMLMTEDPGGRLKVLQELLLRAKMQDQIARATTNAGGRLIGTTAGTAGQSAATPTR